MYKYYLTFGWSQSSKLYPDYGTSLKDYYIIILADSYIDAENYVNNKFGLSYSRLLNESDFDDKWFPLGLLDTFTV